MKRILVTGGAGAIGSHCVRRLMDRGCEVRVLDDLSSGHEKLLPSGSTLIKGSVTSAADLEKAFAFKPDGVIHMAALFANQNSVDHPADDLTINGLGTLNVLEMSRRHAVQKVTYISSSCVYGNKALMEESDTDLNPETPYAITKLLGERYCRFWSGQHGLNTVALRLFNNYGPGEFPGKYRNVIPNFFKLAMDKKSLVITGTGEETRDFNFVDDTVNGILGALFADTAPGDIFNIASGTETSIRDLAGHINRISGNSAAVINVPRRDWDPVVRRVGSIERAARAFGYKPTTPLAEGLRLTHAWLETSG